MKGGSIHTSNIIVLKVRRTKPRYSVSSGDLAENEVDFHILAFQHASEFFTDKPNNIIVRVPTGEHKFVSCCQLFMAIQLALK